MAHEVIIKSSSSTLEELYHVDYRAIIRASCRREDRSAHGFVLCAVLKMNRHHYALYVHNCRLVFLLRKDFDQADTFRPAEFHWKLDQADEVMGLEIKNRPLNGASGRGCVRGPKEPQTWTDMFEQWLFMALKPGMEKGFHITLRSAAKRGSSTEVLWPAQPLCTPQEALAKVYKQPGKSITGGFRICL
ncbi:hypothetical protein P7K49_031680 [Saguinus oedipus]|uniref:Uncharacterized protein n=1 Tax=Saguinus oedipus TaxID=9490 RepID=A0ABQ9U044_SAGOE|nr:hypothetical protein P7K49_031680 [Saguinus oedipus]